MTEWSWQAASNLRFNSPDEGEKQSVRSFLTGFKPLLLAVGAEEIKRVRASEVPLQPAEESLSALKKSFNEMRMDRIFTDVIFETKEGKELHAHRIFLASQNWYFKAMFTEGFKEAKKTLEPFRVTEYQDYETSSLEAILGGSCDSIFLTKT